MLSLRYALGLRCATRARWLLSLWSALSLRCATRARDWASLLRYDGAVGAGHSRPHHRRTSGCRRSTRAA